jgi:hypothetical protein
MIELSIEKDYGNIDAVVLAELKDFLNEELPNYAEVCDENEEETRIELVEVVSVYLDEEE